MFSCIARGSTTTLMLFCVEHFKTILNVQLLFLLHIDDIRDDFSSGFAFIGRLVVRKMLWFPLILEITKWCVYMLSIECYRSSVQGSSLTSSQIAPFTFRFLFCSLYGLSVNPNSCYPCPHRLQSVSSRLRCQQSADESGRCVCVCVFRWAAPRWAQCATSARQTLPRGSGAAWSWTSPWGRTTVQWPGPGIRGWHVAMCNTRMDEPVQWVL